MALILALLLPLVAVLPAAGDCPPRTAQPWEHETRRASMLRGYNKYSLHCPQVSMLMLPSRLQVDKDLGHASLKVSIILEWTDPALVLPLAGGDGGDGGDGEASTLRVNSSDIWTPDIVSSSLDNAKLTPDSVTSSLCEVEPASGLVRSLFRTTLRGQCFSTDAAAWPRDSLYCHFWLRPSHTDVFNLTQRLSVQEVVDAVQRIATRPVMERMASWKVSLMNSKLMDMAGHPMVLVELSLQRLAGQLEALVVHPGCAVTALAPASAALPPGSSGRATMVAVTVLLHAMHLLSLPAHLADLEGGATPRTVLLFRDAGLLILLVALQWLVSLHLACRRSPLPGWLRSTYRGLAVLRTALLLPAVPAAPPAPPQPLQPLQPPDEESVGLSEVSDRLTLLAVGATYVALVAASTASLA